MARDPRLVELGEFLRARRAALGPADVGLDPAEPRRRVPGLRREEVARMALISTDYYVRLEQGRLAPSAAVLADLARVLGLSEDHLAYVFTLAGKNAAAPEAERREPHQVVEPHLQQMLDDLTTTPAFVLGRRTELLGWNAMASALITDFGAIPRTQRQFMRLLVVDPAMRALYEDWEGVTRLAIAQLRMDASRYPENPRLTTLVAELSELDADFAAWWGEHDAAARSTGVKTLHHPRVGTLTLDWNTLLSATDPDQQVVVWTATPGTPSHDRLLDLAQLIGNVPARPDEPVATSTPSSA